MLFTTIGKKKNTQLGLYVFFIMLIISHLSCDSKKSRQVSLSEQSMNSKESVEHQLIKAYNMLDGIGHSGYWSISNNTDWVLGSINTDNAYKGSTAEDNKEATLIEKWNATPEIEGLNEKWENTYAAIEKTNEVISSASGLTDLNKDTVDLLIAEARFLRGFYHLELKKIFNKVPFVDGSPDSKVYTNEKDIWPDIEADFQFAAETLPPKQKKPARANAWAAKAFLANVYMFQNKFDSAASVLDDIIVNGPFRLADCFHDNFRNLTNYNEEFIFGIQMSETGDRTPQANNYADPDDRSKLGGPGNCCQYYQPSQNLVNAYKTNDKGLPLIEHFNETDVKNDEGIDSSEPFTPYTGTVDPRLDWTVGRRGIPYLDWGPHQGKKWIIDQVYSGPYSRKKNVFYKDEDESLAASSGWNTASDAKNITYLRFAYVLLWRAEIAVEEHDLDKARELVNQIRRRAADGCYVKNEDGTAAANYLINPYPSEGYPFDNQENARKAVRFETRLETAMEGHRFFDLRRWGILGKELNEYVKVEAQKRTYLKGTTFEATDQYMPLPQKQIDHAEQWHLKQNPGY